MGMVHVKKKYRYPEKEREQNARQRQIRREIINGYKSERGCAHCGDTDPVVLDLHHMDPNDKRASVAEMAANKAPIDLIQSEIEKCVVLCANCHRKLHAGRFSL